MKAEYVSPKIEFVEFGASDMMTPSDPSCLGHCPNYSCDNYEEGIGCKYNPAWCPED